MTSVMKYLKGFGIGKLLIVLIGVPVLYAAFISGLSTNPGGFYYDEACEAYNGYMIATTGAAENGTSFPLFFQCYTGTFTQWMSPLFIYLMAGLYSVIAPSSLSAHVFSATLVFIAILLLGVLAARISRSFFIGAIVAVTAMATPWFYEVSRIVQETSPLALGIVLFFFCLYNAYRRENWKLSDDIFIGLSLAMITYAYAAGRVLGPAFAFGLLIFAVNRRALFEVFKTWAIYFILLIPFTFVYLTNGDAITARFREVSYITPDTTWWAVIQEFVPAFFGDMSPMFLLVNGDHLYRHHIPVMGQIFVATFILAIAGLIIVIFRHRGEAWWRFLFYAFFVSILPGALTVHRQHALRLLAMPVVLLLFTVPALSFLVGKASAESARFSGLRKFITGRPLRWAVLTLLLATVVAQAVYFQIKFEKWQPERRSYFSWAYPFLFERALEDPSRPIYLQDGRYGPAYILAFWYAAVQKVDLSNFVHLPQNTPPPADSLVLGSETECAHCDMILGKEAFLLYKTRGDTAKPGVRRDAPSVADETLTPVSFGSAGSEPGNFSSPRGVAADEKGNIYVADSANARVQKFDSDMKYLSSLGMDVSGDEKTMEPVGVAITADGNIYVTDVANHKLRKFAPDGHFLKDSRGPDTGFYGPRDIAIGPKDELYIVDSGRSRIVKFEPVDEKFSVWGSAGTAPGQFDGVTGITVADEFVIVVDTGNKRIQAFDFDGNFVRQWTIDAWNYNAPLWPDAVYDAQKKTLYVSNGATKEIIAFDLDGNPAQRITFAGKDAPSDPSAMSIMEANKKRYLVIADTGGARVFMVGIGEVKGKKEDTPRKK